MHHQGLEEEEEEEKEEEKGEKEKFWQKCGNKVQGGVDSHVFFTIDMQKALGLKSLPKATATPNIR